MITLCCQWIEPKKKRNGSIEWINILEERNLQFGAFKNGKYTDEQILAVYIHNITKLNDVMRNKIYPSGIRSFRVSSNLLPLFDQVNPKLLENEKLLSLYKNFGDFCLNNKIRLSCHPSQFCVLSSNTSSVIDNSFKILHAHAWAFDKMGLPETPEYAINLHGGTKGNNKELISSICKLPSNIRKRLTLENDERSFSIKQLLEISKETEVPITFDSHHHSFNPDGLSGEDAMELAIASWRGLCSAQTHLSNTEPGLETGSFTERRKHSELIHTIPEYQLNAANSGRIIVDFEAKNKNVAIFKAVKQLGIIV